jgi:hypothetical protein
LNYAVSSTQCVGVPDSNFNFDPKHIETPTSPRIRKVGTKFWNALFVTPVRDDGRLTHFVLEAEVAFLQKPYLPQSLASKVRQVLDME